MIFWMIFAMLEDPVRYSELSERHQLAPADRLMRQGRYREAAVQYRNLLPGAGDREAVRVPLALALLAGGDFEYAGLELRRAFRLYDAFDRLTIEPEDLFSSRDALVDRLASIRRDSLQGDAWAAYAYAAIVAREPDLARRALDRLDAESDLAVTLEAIRRGEPPPPRGRASPEDTTGFLAKVKSMPEGSASAGKERIPEPFGPEPIRRRLVLKPEIVER